MSEECNLCDGTGEVEADVVADRGSIGCPSCIERELSAQLASVTAERDKLAAQRDEARELVKQHMEFTTFQELDELFKTMREAAARWEKETP